jgi:putative hydrolase of the HAD superfamily
MFYFFDLDGTLLDHEYAQRGGLLAVAKHDAALSSIIDDRFIETWRAAEARLFPRVEAGVVTITEYRRERLRDCFPRFCESLSEADLDTVYAAYLRGYQDSWRLYPDVTNVLSRLDGPKALITNGSSAMQRAKIRALNLEALFSSMYISAEVGVAKPESAIFEKACRDLALRPADVHYVGDSIRNDVEGSAGAGLIPIWINREGVSRPHSVVRFREISSLEELLLA